LGHIHPKSAARRPSTSALRAPSTPPIWPSYSPGTRRGGWRRTSPSCRNCCAGTAEAAGTNRLKDCLAVAAAAATPTIYHGARRSHRLVSGDLRRGGLRPGGQAAGWSAVQLWPQRVSRVSAKVAGHGLMDGAKGKSQSQPSILSAYAGEASEPLRPGLVQFA